MIEVKVIITGVEAPAGLSEAVANLVRERLALDAEPDGDADARAWLRWCQARAATKPDGTQRVEVTAEQHARILAAGVSLEPTSDLAGHLGSWEGLQLWTPQGNGRASRRGGA